MCIFGKPGVDGGADVVFFVCFQAIPTQPILPFWLSYEHVVARS